MAAKPRKPTRAELLEALKDATAHLAGAASAYKRFAGNHKRAGPRDPFYRTRVKDFNAAFERARTVLLKEIEHDKAVDG